MRTQDEIVARIKDIRGSDWLSTQLADLAVYLDREHVREFLKSDANPDEWETKPLTREGVLKEMLEYLDFAFEKALNHRGISASRSIDHMRAFLWLLGDDELLAFAEDAKNYPRYGVPILKAISRKYDKAMPDSILNWEDGESCKPGCYEGCGT